MGSLILLVSALPVVTGLYTPQSGCAKTCFTEITSIYCCNGTTHQNLCLAACNNEENISSCVPGACNITQTFDPPGPALDCSKFTCPTSSNFPLCCKGEIFGNNCLAACSLSLREISECQRGCIQEPGLDCSLVDCSNEILDPLCCDGKDFSSSCKALCEGGIQDLQEQCTVGSCPASCARVICQSGFIDPLCCRNQTFASSCIASCTLLTDDLDAVCTKGVCEQDLIPCPAIFDPVCCNGQTYGNSCESEGVGVIGECNPGVCSSP
eukprot:TRINITY_DN10487_c0_g1_i5.p2 TRINITY_DN10487_c0_g1~~TRINITY_DN10487_c0_g1_i5.p2  ORF type:complete len:306 (+),score=19.18 TRINITY_DN10487_c0_g1_i5:118-918(+)